MRHHHHRYPCRCFRPRRKTQTEITFHLVGLMMSGVLSTPQTAAAASSSAPPGHRLCEGRKVVLLRSAGIGIKHGTFAWTRGSRRRKDCLRRLHAVIWAGRYSAAEAFWIPCLNVRNVKDCGCLMWSVTHFKYWARMQAGLDLRDSASNSREEMDLNLPSSNSLQVVHNLHSF